MKIENFVVVRCEKGDIICKDMDDAHMLIECAEIKHARIEEYDSDIHWSCILKVIEKSNYASLRL